MAKNNNNTNLKQKLWVAASILFIIFSCTSACNMEEIKIERSWGEVKEEVIEGPVDEDILKEAEEIEDKTTAEKTSFEEKLDEIQQKYSLEFRLHLEAMDRNYLESILDDDAAIEKEFGLFGWRNVFYRDRIIFTADEGIFPGDWYDPPIDAEAESLSENETERSKRIIISALDKYPENFLECNLKNVYVLKSMNFFGVDYGGTNSLDSVYVANNGENMGYLDIIIEKEFHHEFSSILYHNYKHMFKESEWRQVNPDGFEYFDEATGGSGAIREGRSSQEFNPEAHNMEFLYEYAQSTLENDINSFAENIFMGDESFFTTAESYEKLKAKLDLIVEFYKTIDPTFTIEYFKGL